MATFLWFVNRQKSGWVTDWFLTTRSVPMRGCFVFFVCVTKVVLIKRKRMERGAKRNRKRASARR